METQLNQDSAVEHALKQLRSKRMSAFELFVQRKKQTKIEAKDQKIDALALADDLGMSVRVLLGKRLGFSFSTAMTPSAISRMIEVAVEIAAEMPEDPYSSFFSFRDRAYPSIAGLDAQGLAVPFEKKAEMALALERTCLNFDPRVTQVRQAGFTETLSSISMVDSEGVTIRAEQTIFSGSVTCKAEQNGEAQMGGDGDFSPFLSQLDVSRIGKTAAGHATELLGAEKVPTMKCPVVLRNELVAEFLEFLSSSFSAEEVDKGRSMLASKQGTEIFSKKVTLINDGLRSGGLGTSPFDGEGVPSCTTTVVEKGRFTHLLTDLYYSKKMHLPLTACAARGIKSPPSISCCNFFIEPGTETPQELIKGIPRGILVTEVMGVHTANPVTGEFSLGASGLLIENGQLGRPVRGFAISGNILEMFRRITDLGNDLRFFGLVGSPSVRVSEMAISGE